MLGKYPGHLTGEGLRVRVDCARCGEGQVLSWLTLSVRSSAMLVGN